MLGNFDIKLYLIRLFVLFLSISVHEWAHAYSAYRYGDDTAARAGRLTLNPIRHFEPVGLVLLLLGAPIAWAKPVPINPSRFRRDVDYKRAMLTVSLSGILCNLLLAFVGSFLFYTTLYFRMTHHFTGTAAVLAELFSDLFSMLLVSNVILAIFNLLPLPPLDGFELFSRILPRRWVYFLESKAYVISMVMLLVIVFLREPFSRFLTFLANPVIYALQWPWAQLLHLILR